MRALAEFLSEDYCARCDSFGHTEQRQHPGMLWCNCCWEWAMRLPSSLRRAIEEVIGER